MSSEVYSFYVPPPQLAEKDREENMSVLLLLVNNKFCGGAVIGSRPSLKNLGSYERVGSSPTPRTIRSLL